MAGQPFPLHVISDDFMNVLPLASLGSHADIFFSDDALM